ncbi:hypothetical protein SAMN05443667_101265 [Flavobacterium gillisiae]|uniref:Uncharacterized protein n=1 Tax=Flavobacterium gillisiae TaxID=150146 RepID=A0A1H3WVQ8_9FLAO|nr:hypothetical protein [Flavobacterium gillisiae]SDZ91257.1 hypothetical protein SAMN05443667_101265 [Flavobacterium gillisiae]
MKVELKITADQVLYLQKKLQEVAVIHPREFVRLSHSKKIENSLLLDCFDKISSKADSISRKPTIFDHKKKYSISFKYHEAAILGTLCCSLKQLEPKDHHNYSLANSLFLLIDKKTQ